jgi:hypothetical protein
VLVSLSPKVVESVLKCPSSSRLDARAGLRGNNQLAAFPRPRQNVRDSRVVARNVWRLLRLSGKGRARSSLGELGMLI